ncbi:Rossmann-like and DUF2520 domain-containing protein [Clostridium vincentii]|uniref:Prephenate dehydrogenase n=1 Tax=Clostridium vincentii TaxID=52704 RepID=A0A2T0BCD4_9CLOT|nr:Rossmann-like and DUF2520 domain-containing protein [Clostridium vincentii]PRR81556.1 prephenate dehydrogenase [Clostridium vincentii]
MEVVTIRIGFIGAGKVGFSLGKYFRDNNLNVIGYYSKNLDSAKEAAEFTDSKYYYDMENLVKECDTIFITTPDETIKKIWSSVKQLSIKGKIICHCSGSLSSRVFSNIEYYNSYGYSIHPMFAFNHKYNSYNDLDKAFFTIEGPLEKMDIIKNLILGIGNKIKVISAENKVKYHVASVIASNHVIALVQVAVEDLKQCGFNEEDALESLYPLISNNIKNIGSDGIINSLTGPIERADGGTIKNHLECLGDEDRELYKLLSRKLIRIAKKKNKDRNYRQIEDMIGD